MNSILTVSLSAYIPFRAHFLEGVFTEEKLRKYDGPELPTLNPRTKWQINTESGVRVSSVMSMCSIKLNLPRTAATTGEHGWVTGGFQHRNLLKTAPRFIVCSLEQCIRFACAWRFLMLLLLSLIILQVFTIQNASLVVSDIPASNGIIHIVSKVRWCMSH